MDNINIRKVRNALKLAKQHGVAGIEFPWKPLMALEPEVLAKLMLAAGIKKFALCVFYGRGGHDPLRRRDQPRVLKDLGAAVNFGYTLASYGLEFVGITGPWGFQIEKTYRKSAALRTNIQSLLMDVADLAIDTSTMFALEWLQSAENKAINDPRDLFGLLNNVDCHYVGAHLDSFHFDAEQIPQKAILEAAGKHLLWYHVSGHQRFTPGGVGDTIEWPLVADGLSKNIELGGSLKAVCFEGFSRDFRKLVPEIGRTYPQDVPAQVGLPLCRKTLEDAGIIGKAT